MIRKTMQNEREEPIQPIKRVIELFKLTINWFNGLSQPKEIPTAFNINLII